MAILLFFVIHWYTSLFFQTFFFHRYAAHAMFKMSKFSEKICYILAWLSQGSSYLSPYAYGVLHRMHHTYADTENDPHSPKYDKNIFTMMWRTKDIYSSIVLKEDSFDEKFKNDLPEWTSFEKFADLYAVRISWALLYTLYYAYFATEWWMYLLLPLHFVMGPLHGAIINWFAHKIGYVNYKVSDTSKNMMPLEVIMLGEGLHNNHHAQSAKANFARKWFEFDPVYPVIRFLDLIKVIELQK